MSYYVKTLERCIAHCWALGSWSRVLATWWDDDILHSVARNPVSSRNSAKRKTFGDISATCRRHWQLSKSAILYYVRRNSRRWGSVLTALYLVSMWPTMPDARRLMKAQVVFLFFPLFILFCIYRTGLATGTWHWLSWTNFVRKTFFNTLAGPTTLGS